MEIGIDFIENLANSLANMSLQNIPKFDHILIDTIPSFGGNPAELNSFISRVREIKNRYHDSSNPTCIQNEIIRSAVFSKLYDNAKYAIEIANAREIDDIVRVLISKFSDRRDDISLTFDLHHMRQLPNETVYQFYERFQNLITIYNNYIYLHLTNKEIILDRCNNFQKSALAVFIAHVKQPYSSLLRNRNVSSLEEALRIIEKDDYVSSVRDDSDHFRYNSKRNSKPQSYQKNGSNFALPRNSNTAIPNYKRQHHFQPHFYNPQMSQPNNFQTNNFQPNSFQSNNFQTNQMTQQPLRPNQQNSPFPNQTNNTTKGSDWTPMSGVSTINSANNKQRHNRLYNLENIDLEQDSYSDEPHVDFQTDEQRQNQT